MDTCGIVMIGKNAGKVGVAYYISKFVFQGLLTPIIPNEITCVWSLVSITK